MMTGGGEERYKELFWFALQIRTRAEKLAGDLLTNKGYETFLPTYRTARHWSDRLKLTERPLFPGYLFCRFCPEVRLPILTTPGVLLVVGAGRIPTPVDDREIEAMRVIVDSGAAACPWPYLKTGDRVRIERGPMAGLEGTLVYTKKRHRLVVSVTLLQRSVAVEVSEDWIRPIRPWPQIPPIAGITRQQTDRDLRSPQRRAGPAGPPQSRCAG